MMRNATIIIICSLLLWGCGGSRNSDHSLGDTFYTPQYAAGFSIMSHGSSTILNITNPWQGAQGVEKSIFLSRDGETPPDGFKGITLKAPLTNVICMSSTHIAYIDAIGELDAIKGVSGVNYISNPLIQEKYDKGDIRDVGYDNYVNYEVIASLRPQLVMLYGVAGENMMERKLTELGINVTYIGDYVENSPLGKAEWVVALGEMFDKREEAVIIFNEIRDSYLATKEIVEKSTAQSEKPVVMLNSPYRDTWFVPGDRSYMVRLINDAGGSYACKGDDSERSRPLSGEAAFVFANGSDIWLNPGVASSLNEVESMNPKFKNIPPVKDRKVYNCTARGTPEGGSDFWESGALRADIVLADMVRIFHPGILPEEELYYFKKLE